MNEHKSINVGIIGATGHTGEELIDILLRHPRARIAGLYNTSDEPRGIPEVFPRFLKRINAVCRRPDMREIARECDIVFLALPHTVSMRFVPKLLAAGRRVIDLSADYRLKNKKIYESNYGIVHKDSSNLSKAVYGLPELYRRKIKDARLIANPGCYPTAGILALAPLFAAAGVEKGSVIIDAKSGVSGAGKRLRESMMFGEVNEDFKAYKVNVHQHAPEIAQELSKLAGSSVEPVFVPYLLPLNRGILATAYVRRKKTFRMNEEQAVKLYRNFYRDEPFVRVKDAGSFPRLKDVAGTNFCDIGVRVSPGMIIVIAAIDNLVKGASGQAVQNMNIMCGFPETSGL